MKRRPEPARRARESRIAVLLFSFSLLFAAISVAGPWTVSLLGHTVPWGLYPLFLLIGLAGMLLVQRRQRRSLGSKATRVLIRSSMALAIAIAAVLLHWISI